MAIKFAACADLHQLQEFIAGRQIDAPQEALQVLDIVLRELSNQRCRFFFQAVVLHCAIPKLDGLIMAGIAHGFSFRYVSVGRSFYSPDIRRPQHLGDGLQSWCGFYQSIRPTQMGLSLNIGRNKSLALSVACASDT